MYELRSTNPAHVVYSPAAWHEPSGVCQTPPAAWHASCVVCSWDIFPSIQQQSGQQQESASVPDTRPVEPSLTSSALSLVRNGMASRWRRLWWRVFHALGNRDQDAAGGTNAEYIHVRCGELQPISG